MTDFGTMAQRIKDEVLRDTSADTTYAKKAIVSAIRHYRYHRFWFNESTFTMDTADGTAEYSAVSSGTAGYPDDLVRVDTMRLLHNNSLYPLCKVGIDELRDLQTSDTFEASPKVWAWHHEKIILWPTPDQAYTVRAEYIKELDGDDGGDTRGPIIAKYESSAWTFEDSDGNTITDAYTNAWFDEAEEMIRSRAKALVYSEVLHNIPAASQCLALAENAYRNLKSQHDHLQMPESTTPWY